MTSNIQPSSSQMNQISQHSSGLHESHQNQLIPNPHSNISPMSRVSILKTEEQKEIVRTNVFEPNNITAQNDPNFTVVTEVIKRNSNISLETKSNNVPNKVDIRFSFNKPNSNIAFENRTINVNVIDTKENREEIYKLLIKRIAKQLKNKIRQPTHGFFYFAFQKGNYPLMIIRKLEGNIINHSIELNSDIFQVYTQKYFRYKELVKKIALLLKRHLSNKMFWENERYKKESIQVKVTNKNNISSNANIKNNSHGHNANNANNANKKNINNSIKATILNKKVTNNNIKNPQTNQLNNQKKIKSHVTKSNNINNTKNNLSHPSASQNNFGNHRFNNNFINPFNAAKTQTQNQKEKKGNLTKKSEKSTLFNKSLKNKNGNNNGKNESSRSASSENNKTGKIKFMNLPKIPEMPIKDSTSLNQEIKNNSEKTQVITLSKKTVNNNMFNIQKISDSSNDIEMKDESNVVNQETNINNNNEPNEQKTLFNMKMIPHRNTDSIMTNTNLNNSSSLNVQVPNNNSSIMRQNNVQKITFDSIKSPGKKLQIKLSPLKKTEDIIKENIKQSQSKSKKQILKPEIKIDINEINIPLNNDKITDEHISYINKFKVLMSNNDIIIEYNIPMSKSLEGVNHLKKYEFWEKYIYYLYINYLIDKKNKLSLFTFIHLIEQYFLWCEYGEAESAKKFKKLIIDIINKVFSEKDLKQFLSMNKINNLEELFAKYEVFMKYGNKINYQTNKEIEIKIDNDEECNCELCKNEKACVKKISEMNKKTNINMSIESIQFKAEYSPKAKQNINPNNHLETNNYSISFAGKNKSGLFSKSKTMHSFETVYQYIPPKINQELLDIEEKNEKETYPKRKSKSKSKSKSKNKSKRSSKKNDEETYIDLTKDTKLEEFFEKEEDEENKEENKEEEKEEELSSNNKSRSRKKNSKRNNKKNKKKISSFIKDETESESEEKDKKKDKKKKKQKSKSRNKSYNSRKYPVSDSETESDESDFTKNKNKKVSHNPKRKKGKSKW